MLHTFILSIHTADNSIHVACVCVHLVTAISSREIESLLNDEPRVRIAIQYILTHDPNNRHYLYSVLGLLKIIRVLTGGTLIYNE